MGTYDTAGGTARHDPTFDANDDILPFEEVALERMEEAQRRLAEYEAASESLTEVLRQAMRALIKPGMVIDLNQRKGLPAHLWNVGTTRGNDRGTRVFRIESEPRVDVDVRNPDFSKWLCEATPISEKTGKDMSGAATRGVQRATVQLHGRIAGHALDDKAAANDIAMRTVRLAAEALSSPAEGSEQ